MQERLFEVPVVDDHLYDDANRACACGYQGTDNLEARLTWDPKALEMNKLWHLYHRVEEGLPFHYEKFTSPDICAACSHETVAYKMISGNVEIKLCDYSAREYAIVLHHMYKIPLAEPFTCDCNGCKELAEELTNS